MLLLGCFQVMHAQKTRELLKSKLQAALQEEVALVERMQGLESDKAELEERAARMEECLACCQQELAAARDGDAEAAALADKLGESAARIRELEEKLGQAQRESEGLCAERAGLRARAEQLEQEVRIRAPCAKSIVLGSSENRVAL
jgi:predicted  nucleic acid-binding Zn-ribbon protein